MYEYSYTSKNLLLVSCSDKKTYADNHQKFDSH